MAFLLVHMVNENCPFLGLLLSGIYCVCILLKSRDVINSLGHSIAFLE